MVRKRNREEDSKVKRNPEPANQYALILHNDDVHDFNYVIESLVEICGHDSVQAEQCAYIVHYRGECDVKTGKYGHLKLIHEKLCEKDLIVTLNEQVCH